MYGKVLSAVILPAAIVLPNTGSKVAAIVALTSIVIGVVALATTIASAIAKRTYR